MPLLVKAMVKQIKKKKKINHTKINTADNKVKEQQ